MDNDEQPRPPMGARPKRRRLPNALNNLRRALVQPRGPVQPMTAIPPFADSLLSRDWTLEEGLIGPVYDQFGETCASFALCRLLQALHNRGRAVALHHQFSIKDLSDYVKSKTKKVSISNINIALDYIINTGLLKRDDGRLREASTHLGHRIGGRFEVKRDFTKDQAYALIQEIPFAISLEDTKPLKNLGPQEIYDVPVGRVENEPEPTDHTLLVVGKGSCTKTGKEFLVVQNSWGVVWGNQGYGRISLDPAGEFGVFWPTEVVMMR